MVDSAPGWARDNEDVTPTGFIHQAQLAEAVAWAERVLAPLGVIRIRHTVGEDWSGEPAVYFRVLLSDAASDPARLRDVTRNIEAVIDREVDPLNAWGLFAYFNFRSQSEQAVIQEPAWA